MKTENIKDLFQIEIKTKKLEDNSYGLVLIIKYKGEDLLIYSTKKWFLENLPKTAEEIADELVKELKDKYAFKKEKQENG